jgi:glycosyltransferase involved in cell wall biosynthesis
MSCGLPVVAYDLPVYNNIFVKGMIKVPITDKTKFAETIIKLLENKSYYKKIRSESIELSQGFSWKRFSQKIISIINKT